MLARPPTQLGARAQYIALLADELFDLTDLLLSQSLRYLSILAHGPRQTW
jgi:hypothetical protein